MSGLVMNFKDRLRASVSIHTEREGILIDVALPWIVDSHNDTGLGYTNSIRTSDGGTHLDGMKAVVTRTLNTLDRKANILKGENESFSGDHARECLACAVAVKVPNPEFEGQTKTRLGNLEVRRSIELAVQELVTEHLEQYGNTLEAILTKALQASKAAMAARKARGLLRPKNVMKFSMLPGKESV